MRENLLENSQHHMQIPRMLCGAFQNTIGQDSRLPFTISVLGDATRQSPPPSPNIDIMARCESKAYRAPSGKLVVKIHHSLHIS